MDRKVEFEIISAEVELDNHRSASGEKANLHRAKARISSSNVGAQQITRRREPLTVPPLNERRDDFFDDEGRVRRYWEGAYNFRTKELGMSHEDAAQWSDESVSEYQEIVEGAFENEFEIPVSPEFTIAATPLNETEKRYWDQRIEFRTNVLGMTLEDATEWTTSDIEGERQFAALHGQNSVAQMKG